MVSILTSVGIALLMGSFAAWKGRTGWHWFCLTIVAYATIWALTAIGVHYSDIRISIRMADREFAAFTSILTAAILLVILIAVPRRPRRRSAARDHTAHPSP